MKLLSIFCLKSIIFFCLLLIVPKTCKTQISCVPIIGDRFVPIQKGVNVRILPNINSEIFLTTPEASNHPLNSIYFQCVQEGFQNDFLKVQVKFGNDFIERLGVNPKIIDLYWYLVSKYSSFNEFYILIQDSIGANKIYNELQEEDPFFIERNKEQEIDVSTFEKFYKYFVEFPVNENGIKYLLEKNEHVAYVHKSVVKTPILGTPYRYNISIEEYYDWMQNIVEIDPKINCSFNPNEMYLCLFGLVNALIDDNKAFKAIQEVLKYEKYLSDTHFQLKLEALKKKASFYDGNYQSSLTISKKLITEFKLGNISNLNLEESYDQDKYGSIDMPLIYGIAISCCIHLNKFSEGLTYSKFVLNNPELQFGNYVDFHAIILLNLGHKIDACNFLNEHYQKGHDGARNLYMKYCK